MHQKDDEMLNVEQQRIAEDLRTLAEGIPYRDEFRVQLRAQLIARAENSEVDNKVKRPALWPRLRLGVRRIRQIFAGGVTMKKGLAFATLVVLVIALGTMTLVPSVRAQVGETLNTWFRFLTPGGGGEAAVFGPKTFTPLRPSYLPAGFQSWMVKLSGKAGRESIELVYHFGDQFVAITQTKAAADRALPPGQEVTINGGPAVLVTGLQGTIDLGPRIPKGALKETVVAPPAVPTPYGAEIEPLTYTDGKQLTWYVGDVKIQMLSNLSVAEMLKIAESLVPAEAGEEKLPQPPPGNIPPSGSGGGVQKGPIQSQP